MDFFFEKLTRPLLFKQDPESAHELAITGLKLLASIAPLRLAMEKFNLVKYSKPVNVFGVNFPNCVGLAAGFDKDATCWRAMPALGFGFSEIGTFTKHKQAGNQKPRVFRYPENEAVVNSMGFPNEGSEAAAKRLSKTISSKKTPLGINIGKSKVTPLEEAASDYIFSFNTLADYADYFCLNLSSPNTPELRKLQTKEYLHALLDSVQQANIQRAEKLAKKRIPLLVKIAPDLSFSEIDEILETMQDLSYDGIVATNTTISRPEKSSYETSGGLSGKPLFEKSLEIVSYISKHTNAKLPIIGVGGINDAECAGKMLNAGASLIQIYTPMIFRGPFYAKYLAKSAQWRHEDWL